jgi:hypothetical protein
MIKIYGLPGDTSGSGWVISCRCGVMGSCSLGLTGFTSGGLCSIRFGSFGLAGGGLFSFDWYISEVLSAFTDRTIVPDYRPARQIGIITEN